MEREKMKNKKKPRLLFFHLYGYAGESVLQGTSSFGRKTGAEETDIAVPPWYPDGTESLQKFRGSGFTGIWGAATEPGSMGNAVKSLIF